MPDIGQPLTLTYKSHVDKQVTATKIKLFMLHLPMMTLSRHATFLSLEMRKGV